MPDETVGDLLVVLVQFIHHRTATHDAKTKECKTCQASDRIIQYTIKKYTTQEQIDEVLALIAKKLEEEKVNEHKL